MAHHDLHVRFGCVGPPSGRGRDLPFSFTHEPSRSTDHFLLLVNIPAHIEATAPSSCCDPNIVTLERSLFGHTLHVSSLDNLGGWMSGRGSRIATVTCVDKTENFKLVEDRGQTATPPLVARYSSCVWSRHISRGVKPHCVLAFHLDLPTTESCIYSYAGSSHVVTYIRHLLNTRNVGCK